MFELYSLNSFVHTFYIFIVYLFNIKLSGMIRIIDYTALFAVRFDSCVKNGDIAVKMKE